MTDRGRYRFVLGAAVQVHAVSTRLDASGSVRTLTPHIFNLVTVNRRGVLLLRPFLSVVVSETQGLILSSVLPGRLGATLLVLVLSVSVERCLVLTFHVIFLLAADEVVQLFHCHFALALHPVG